MSLFSKAFYFNPGRVSVSLKIMLIDIAIRNKERKHRRAVVFSLAFRFSPE